MKDIIKPGIILMAYGLIAGLALGIINSKTAPVIAAQEEAARMAAIRAVLPTATTFVSDTVDGVEYISGYADDDLNELVGYVITAYGAGFSSTIRTVVGLSTDFTITAIEVVYQSETPGLGTKVLEVRQNDNRPWFLNQFDGREISQLDVDKDEGEIVSITGATITSRAVTRSVAEAAGKLKTAIESKIPPEVEDMSEIEEIADGGEK